MIIKLIVGGSFFTNCYIVGDEDSGEAILIDPGAQWSEAVDIIRAEGLKVDRIVNTHAHIDHVSGVEDAKQALGARFLLHRAELPVLQDIPNAIRRFPEFSGTKIPEVDQFVEEGDVIEVGKYRAEVLHTPGHTPGHIVLVFDGHVFDGDTLFAGSVGRVDLTGGSSMEELLHSIRTKILTLPDHYRIYSGHGPVTTVEREKRTNPFIVGGGLIY